MNLAHLLAVFLPVYFWSLFPLGWLYPNVPASFRSGPYWAGYKSILFEAWESRALLATVTTLAVALW